MNQGLIPWKNKYGDKKGRGVTTPEKNKYGDELNILTNSSINRGVTPPGKTNTVIS
jgi:hypothetical protein